MPPHLLSHYSCTDLQVKKPTFEEVRLVHSRLSAVSFQPRETLDLSVLADPSGSKSISSIIGFHESKTTGPKSWLKKMFVFKISTAYVSGVFQQALIKQLGFNQHKIITLDYTISKIKMMVSERWTTEVLRGYPIMTVS